MEHAAHPCLPAVRPMVDPLLRLLIAVLFLCGREQVERHGNKTEAVRPSKSQQIEAAQILMGHMVMDPREEFHRLAAVPRKDGIVQHKHFYTARAGQGAEHFRNPDCKQEQETMPVEGRVAEEPIKGVLGNVAVGMLGMQEPEQVLTLNFPHQK